MIKVFKKESRKYDEIRIINMETGEFKSYLMHKEVGFPFSFHKTTVYKMGYDSIKECMKSLKDRKYLGVEIDLQEQREAERIGYINLGVERIKRKERINTTDFEDVIEKLSAYGMGFVDAQNVITESYLQEVK